MRIKESAQGQEGQGLHLLARSVAGSGPLCFKWICSTAWILVHAVIREMGKWNLFFLWQRAHSFHLLMIFTQGWISLAFVFRSWGQRLRSAENSAFILWIQKRSAKKILPVACPMQTGEMSSAAGGTWSTHGFIFAHWMRVFSFSQRHPAHPTPLPNKLRGGTAFKEESEVHFPS